MEKDSIKKEAKQIMDNFMSALSEIEVEEEFILKREAVYREENGGDDKDASFQNRFLSNAPKTSGNAILANRGDWTK